MPSVFHVGSEVHITMPGPFRFPPYCRSGSVFFRFDAKTQDLVDTNAGAHDSWAGVMEEAKEIAFPALIGEEASDGP